jgi:hypothetical protein
MSSPLPGNVQNYREHLVAHNRCVDRSPDLRLGAVTGGGRPITPGLPTAQNHFTINITNQPGAVIDIVKLNDIASATSTTVPGPLSAPAPQPLPRTRLGPNDLRRFLLQRTATSKRQPAPDAQFPTASSAPAFPAPRPPGDSKSAKRRKRNARTTENKLTQALVSRLPPAATTEQMSELLLEVASLRKEVNANRKPFPTPADHCRRAPSSPPGPAPESFDDARLRLSMQYGYYPLCAGNALAPPLQTPDVRPLDTDRSFRPLRDSDHLLRRRPPRSRSPLHSPNHSSRCRRLELSTPTPSVINSFLSPFRRNASGPKRSRSPSHGSRSSSSAWSRSDGRGPKRPRSDSPHRRTQPRKCVWRPI